MTQELSSLASGPVSWQHPYPQSTRLNAFRQYVNRRHGLNLVSYDELHKWSVENVEDFGQDIWIFCGMISSVMPQRTANGIDAMWPRPEWFPGARINFTENILSTGLMAHPDRIAISSCRESGTHWRHLTWAQLRHLVALYVSALRSAGVQTGDRIAGILTNSIEAVILLLAAGSIGAIFSSTAPDMGTEGIISRYSQIRPKLIFVDTEVLYAGRRRVLRKKLDAAISKLRETVPDLTRVIVITGAPLANNECISLDRFLDVPITPLQFAQLPFDHPIYILHSSGTTGPPKSICHSAGGALLQQKKEYILSNDMGPDSTYYQYTTTGWMMWNYLLGSLSVGSRIVLYDGSPLYPSPAYQVQLLEEQGVTHWGTSPKLLSVLKETGWKRTSAFEQLRVVISAGSPLSPEIFRWFYTAFPSQVGLFSGSGGTDLVGSIVSGHTLAKIHEGELASAHLGMRVEVWDETGRNIDHTGEQGELVITAPFFSMPVNFYGDEDGEKYRKAYFDKFPGVWCHGDYIHRNPNTGGFVIHGRSDGVLNPGGVRFGTAEIYNVVEKFSEVDDCIAVGQQCANTSDEQVLLFLKMNALDFNETKMKVADSIRNDLSPRHVPAHILRVQDIPYTLNGKKIEMAVKAVVNNREVANIDSVANPQCLEEYRKFTALASPTTAPRL